MLATIITWLLGAHHTWRKCPY